MYKGRQMKKRAYILMLSICIICFLAPCNGLADEEVKTTFIFTGHLRGPKNFVINSLMPFFINDIDVVKKDFVLLGGDIICGYVTAYDEKGLSREWEMVDYYLRKIDVPVYRVPGNHDLHSTMSKYVFNKRYGPEYFSFKKNNVFVIGLNTVKLCPEESIEWGHIWHTNADLPNIVEMPQGAQKEFFVDAINKAVIDSGIDHIVIFMNGELWLKDDWWKHIHPLLARSKKRCFVLSGETGDNKNMYFKKDDISYIRNGWSISDDSDFILGGSYLQITLGDKDDATVYFRLINARPQYMQEFFSAIPLDTQRHLTLKMRETIKGNVTLNKFRAFIRDWMNKHILVYDRAFNIHIIVFTMIALALFSLLFMYIQKKKV
jgi:hypothetical protein